MFKNYRSWVLIGN